MTARFWEKAEEGGAVRCGLCPHACLIRPGGLGRCRVRRNREGTLELPFYGRLSSIAVDPIEKKPLYHYHPGERILSVGFVGCSFHCPFCQNYRISQDTGVDEATLCRIVQRKSCSVETADILLKYFGLTITKRGKRKAR